MSVQVRTAAEEMVLLRRDLEATINTCNRTSIDPETGKVKDDIPEGIRDEILLYEGHAKELWTYLKENVTEDMTSGQVINLIFEKICEGRVVDEEGNHIGPFCGFCKVFKGIVAAYNSPEAELLAFGTGMTMRDLEYEKATVRLD